MTEEQYFFLKLAEEASEVAHMCSKIMQFGPNDMMENTQPDNVRRLTAEINDFLGVLNYMVSLGIFDFKESPSAQDAKVAKLLKYLKMSRDMGYVEESRSKAVGCDACFYSTWINLEDPVPNLCPDCNEPGFAEIEY